MAWTLFHVVCLVSLWSVHAGAFASGTWGSHCDVPSFEVAGGKVHLTFDDGPNAKTTPELLDILDAVGAKATFFLTGVNILEAQDNGALVRDIIRRGHLVGSHTWSHARLSSASSANVLAELSKTEEALLQSTGLRTFLLRAPYGALSPEAHQLAEERNYTWVGWNADSLDWSGHENALRVEEQVEQLLMSTTQGQLLLLHEYPWTTEAMSRLARKILALDYEFVPLTEFLSEAQKEQLWEQYQCPQLSPNDLYWTTCEQLGFKKPSANLFFLPALFSLAESQRAARQVEAPRAAAPDFDPLLHQSSLVFLPIFFLLLFALFSLEPLARLWNRLGRPQTQPSLGHGHKYT